MVKILKTRIEIWRNRCAIAQLKKDEQDTKLFQDKERLILDVVFKKNYDELTKEEIVAIYKARIETFIVGQDLNYQEIDDTDKKSWHLFEMNDDREVISLFKNYSRKG